MTRGAGVDWRRHGEAIRMAVASSRQSTPDGGTSGVEIEFNVLDGDLAPLERVGFGPEARSFADALHDEALPEWVRGRFQLEVFHWMTEATTRPWFDPAATAAEARLLEAVLANVLADMGRAHGRTLLALHGPLPSPVSPGRESIPGGWNLARRRYLERCVALFGGRLATAGVHTNHSLPEALLSWDFLHLPLTQRRGRTLETYRNDAVIRLTRLLRPYCPLFIAVSAASPLTLGTVAGRPEVVLGEADSHRLLAFPNPPELDVPSLYASHEDYLRISYELVRSGVRFGANNWTPVRARSDVEPVNRNILGTAEQLRDLYRRGLYPAVGGVALDEAERRLIEERMCARVDLPMQRVEVRTDEGGDDLHLATAKIAFKELLALSIYLDPEHGAGYRYDAGDVTRARANEELAALRGLDAEIDHPFGAGAVTVREWLGAELEALAPLAEGLGWHAHLVPLREMAGGGPNPARAMRSLLERACGGEPRDVAGRLRVPRQAVAEWVADRTRRLADEARTVAAGWVLGDDDRRRLAGLTAGLRALADRQPTAPVRLTPPAPRIAGLDDRSADVVSLACDLIRIPSVTNCAEERLDEVRACARFVAGWLEREGLRVRLLDDGPYPAVLAAPAGAGRARVTLCGHFDVVQPEPDDGQFEPRVEGDWLWGRGAADMKTVVASFMVWLREAARGTTPPPVNLLLVGNEENGEAERWGTPHVLELLRREDDWTPELMVVGERTGEQGTELYGRVCPSSRGIARLRLTARGRRGHTGTGSGPGDLLDRLVEVRAVLDGVLRRHLTLSATDGWESAARFPFLLVGEKGVYNITAGEGVLGLEIRPIPEDDVAAAVAEVGAVARELELELAVEVMEPGVVCPPDDPLLAALLASVQEVSGAPAVVGRKLPGSSARFAPGGRQVVWGQTGIGPHSREERHLLPSVRPYLEVLDAFGRRLVR